MGNKFVDAVNHGNDQSGYHFHIRAHCYRTHRHFPRNMILLSHGHDSYLKDGCRILGSENQHGSYAAGVHRKER